MKHYEHNPRQISKKELAQLKRDLEELGDLGGVVHDLSTDEIIGGNQRSEAIEEIISGKIKPTITKEYKPKNKQGTVKVGYFDWRGEQFKYRAVKWDAKTRQRANIRANKAGGDWNWDSLANDFEASDLIDWGFDTDTLKDWKRNVGALGNLIESEKPEIVDVEVDLDRAAELNKKWGVTRGQLWRLGDHRLLCGDSTCADDVARLMQGEKAGICLTDPPYNVGFDYDGKTVDDNKSAELYEAFSRSWFGECQRVSDKQIVTAGCNNLPQWLRWFDSYHVGTWIKSNSMTNGRVSRFWCWEPVIFFGEKFGKKRTSDIFDYPIGQQKQVANHPCPKPLEMWKDLIENYSESGDLIFDCFGGSGTTMVACNNLNRQCFMCELSENYCAVILQRMSDSFPDLTIERIE